MNTDNCLNNKKVTQPLLSRLDRKDCVMVFMACAIVVSLATNGIKMIGANGAKEGMVLRQVIKK